MSPAPPAAQQFTPTVHPPATVSHDCPACGWTATYDLARARGRRAEHRGLTRSTRASRLAHPLARDALRQITQDRPAAASGPLQSRRTDLDTGQVTQIPDPVCGATLEATCPACAQTRPVAARRAMPGRLAPPRTNLSGPTPARRMTEQEFWLHPARPPPRCAAIRPLRNG